MSDQRPPEPRCINCGAGNVPIDSDGLCQACFTVRGFQSVAEMFQHGSPSEVHRETVTGQRLASLIATAAARMPQGERTLLWLECYRLMGEKLDAETQPELCATIDALRDPLPDETQASKWN